MGDEMTNHGGRFDKSWGTFWRPYGGQKDKPRGTECIDLSPNLWYTAFRLEKEANRCKNIRQQPCRKKQISCVGKVQGLHGRRAPVARGLLVKNKSKRPKQQPCGVFVGRVQRPAGFKKSWCTKDWAADQALSRQYGVDSHWQREGDVWELCPFHKGKTGLCAGNKVLCCGDHLQSWPSTYLLWHRRKRICPVSAALYVTDEITV